MGCDLISGSGKSETGGGTTVKIVVLGGGRVGNAIVRDLAAEDDLSVLVVDVDPDAVEQLTEHGADGVVADLSDPDTVSKAVVDADLVVSAVPGFMGYETVQRVLQEGRPVVDISFFREDAFGLDELAKEAGVPCLVGGLPVERTWPWEYKAPFSPADLIQVYKQPVRIRRHGVEVTLPALSDVELVDFAGLGTLEAFNTDGLHSLLRTSKTPSASTP
jgi:saccharopine dehydrogenase-like NADP-dependent oxidoreductase